MKPSINQSPIIGYNLQVIASFVWEKSLHGFFGVIVWVGDDNIV